VATQPQPVKRTLPWNTCGDTQGLVRKPVQPSSIDCNFMSRLTKKAEPPPTRDVNHDSGTAMTHGGLLRRLVELSRCAAEECSRLVDNPTPEVDHRFMQHASVLCCKSRRENRMKFCQKQRGSAKSKRHIFTGGLRGRFSIIDLLATFAHHFDFW
jgi:hypothetical protein